MITIVRQGIAESVPEEARYCPVCQSGPATYELKTDYKRRFQSQCQMGTVNSALLPTFECDKCGCIWQWEPDNEEKGNV